MDMKLEVVVVPVSNVGRAKGIYESLGWRLNDFPGDSGFRVVQLTLPARRARSSSAAASLLRIRARQIGFSSSSPISRRPEPNWSTEATR